MGPAPVLGSRTWRTVGGLVLLVVVVLLGARLGGAGDPAGTSGSRSSVATDSGTASAAATDPQTGLAWVEEADLPPQAVEVLAAIDAGGPFDHPGKDGSIFNNFEGLLPAESRGHYHEYTVETPGSADRGARRIVTGGPRDAPTQWFWTADHYASFERIRR